MKNYYEYLWKVTGNWKFEPVILIWNLLTMSLFWFPINFIGIFFYILFDKKFRGKHLKKFIWVNLAVGIIFLATAFMTQFTTMFVLGFDDSGYFSSEESEFIFTGAYLIVICLQIFYSFISARIYQKQKNLCYKGE